jgi:putative oxidoreductase
MKATFHSILCALLVLLFTYAAVSKLINIDLFRTQLYLQPIPHSLADILLYALPTSEVLITILLCYRGTQLTALWFSLGLLIVFTVYISLGLLHYWKQIPCSCGGILNHMSWTAHYIFNWTFVLINLAALLSHTREWRPHSPASA